MRDRVTDPVIRETLDHSPSHLSMVSAWPEYARSRPVSGPEQQLSGGSGGGGGAIPWSSPRPRSLETENFGGNRCFSCLNRLSDPVGAGTGRLVRMGSVQRLGNVLGMERESTFMKFQWDNLLVEEKPINHNVKRQYLGGGFCDSGVVPIPMSMESCFGHRVGPGESSRNYGVIDGGTAGYACCLGKFEMRGKRTSNVDSIVHKIEGNNNGIDSDSGSRDSMMRDRRALLEDDASFGENERDLDCRSLNLNPEEVQFVTEFGYDRHVGSGSGSGGNGSDSYRDGFERMPRSYEEMYSSGSSSQRMVMTPEEASEMRFKRNCSLDMETNNDNQNIRLSRDWNAYNERIPDSSCGNGDWTHEDIKQFSMLKNSGWGQHQGIIDRTVIHKNDNSGNSLSYTYGQISKQRLSSKPVKPSKRDIRNRLGPVQSVKQRLGPAPNAGKRLGLALKIKKKLPRVKTQKKQTLEDFEQDLNVQGVKFLEVKKKTYAKTEPPEDSEEFMQLVQSAFLKFVKLLNENSANRRKYWEQGGAGTLKCSICGSTSREFVDTLSLAQHAFTSCKVGSRSEHLGFHKALCVLMGWDNKKFPNGQWVRQILSDAEASSLKEDLIIWPPVVLIHNSSIANDNLKERIIVSIEGLRNILRDMGCNRGMTNLCRVKAANQSIMMVSFSGTFSGLQEAERLHRLFSEKKCGRAELQRIVFSDCKKNCHETPRVLGDKVESVLYGYLGNAIDLDRLDFETKKRCVVKSKKEIEAIANAYFNTK